MGTSVLTITKGRNGHLANLLAGLEASAIAPDEVVVAHMNEAVHDHATRTFAHRPFVVEAPSALPLALARNRAAAAARHDRLVFLDVDCVPSPGLVGRYRAALDAFDGVLMGEVAYLRRPLPLGWTQAACGALAEPHPSRPHGLPDAHLAPTGDAHLFWSLNFAVTRRLFERVGGFDETFAGYGAEDTDFAFKARRLRERFAWVGGARAYHQPHATHAPPLQHFEAIVANARRFKAKWGVWPMLGWLKGFEGLGLIVLDDEACRVVRRPTAAEVAAARTDEGGAG